MEDKQVATILLRVPQGVKEMADKEAGKLGISTNAFVSLLIQSYADGIKFERGK